jgi:tetratricopeptide (TPR) repeat protein
VRLQEALGWVRRALELDPNNAAYLDSYGWGWYRLGEAKKALEPLARAAELVPGEVLILKHLGQVQEAAGERDAAMDTYRRALKIEPMDQELPVWLKRLENPSPREGEHPTE